MADRSGEVLRLAREFEGCRKILMALGDENRQHLMLEMLRMDHCGGVRVGTITEKATCPVRPCHTISESSKMPELSKCAGRAQKTIIILTQTWTL